MSGRLAALSTDLPLSLPGITGNPVCAGWCLLVRLVKPGDDISGVPA